MDSPTGDDAGVKGGELEHVEEDRVGSPAEIDNHNSEHQDDGTYNHRTAVTNIAMDGKQQTDPTFGAVKFEPHLNGMAATDADADFVDLDLNAGEERDGGGGNYGEERTMEGVYDPEISQVEG